MANVKNDVYNSEDIEMAQYLKAIAHPARIMILRKLAGMDSCMTGNIVDDLPLAQSTVSQHLKELKSVGLIKGSISGTKTKYCIDVEKWDELKANFALFLKEIDADPKSAC